MKNLFKIIISLVLVTGVVMTSCVKDEFDQPEIPDLCKHESGLTPTSNLTVQRLMAEYSSFPVLDADGEVRTFPSDSNYVFEGVVVSSDQDGNIYKAIYVQDETGGIMLSVDATNTFNDYRLGQTVHIKLTGLTCHYATGSYETSMIEIGFGQFADSHGQKIGRIPATTIPLFVKTNSCPKAVTPLEIDLLSAPTPNHYIGKLVTINNIEFVKDELDSNYAQTVPEKKTVDRHIQNCNENTIIIRNSGYAAFASIKLPQGNGSITGIYTVYNNTVQLLVNSLDDVQISDIPEDRCDYVEPIFNDFDNPITVTQAIEKNEEGHTGLWVKGYIVGTYYNEIFEGFDYEAPFNTIGSDKRVCIADSPDETDPTKLIFVQLDLLGLTSIKDSTNLMDNPDLHNKEIKYYGDLDAYNSENSWFGMKNIQGYWLTDKNEGIMPQ